MPLPDSPGPSRSKQQNHANSETSLRNLRGPGLNYTTRSFVSRLPISDKPGMTTECAYHYREEKSRVKRRLAATGQNRPAAVCGYIELAAMIFRYSSALGRIFLSKVL